MDIVEKYTSPGLDKRSILLNFDLSITYSKIGVMMVINTYIRTPLFTNNERKLEVLNLKAFLPSNNKNEMINGKTHVSRYMIVIITMGSSLPIPTPTDATPKITEIINIRPPKNFLIINNKVISPSL